MDSDEIIVRAEVVEYVDAQELDIDERLAIGRINHGEQKNGECPVCFEHLSAQPVCVFMGPGKIRRTCEHYFHLHCAQELLTAECPLCGVTFREIVPLPNPERSAHEWFRAIDARGNGRLDRKDVLAALQAHLPLDDKKLEHTLTLLWSKWDHTNDGFISMEEMLNPKGGLLSFVLKAKGLSRAMTPIEPPVLSVDTKEEFFNYWDDDESGTLEKEELVRSIVKTYRLDRIDLIRVAAIRSVVDAVFPVFDIDNTGGIDRFEFSRPDGLADTLIAQLHFENNAPRSANANTTDTHALNNTHHAEAEPHANANNVGQVQNAKTDEELQIITLEEAEYTNESHFVNGTFVLDPTN